MKIFLLTVIACATVLFGADLPSPGTFYPFAPAAGQSGSTAIHMNSPSFVGWADGYRNVAYGSNVSANWMTPTKALGKASDDTFDIVCLGRGGSITLTFSTPIANGVGFDLAVFENSNDDTFLELGWVEVSSDGIHFCRFPNYYGGTAPIGGFGAHSPTKIYGLASKYRLGYGTPFDLQELQDAYDSIIKGKASFLSAAYKNSITANFPFLDLNNIGYVKIIDIVGNGTAKDSTDKTIYDPYPTVGSAGFDLNAIGVINQRQPPSLSPQTITFAPLPNQWLGDGAITLTATSSSGLPVAFTITEGPATVSGSTLSFTGSGAVTVTVAQPGDATYAPADNVVRSFVIAEHTQHIYLAPVPNLLEGAIFQLHASSSRGLPVSVEVLDGDAVTDASNRLTAGSAGTSDKTVTLRAFQIGNATTAPAEDVYMQVKVVKSSSADAPQSFSQWSTLNTIAANATADNDGDGFNNFDEFMADTSPVRAQEKPEVLFVVEATAGEQQSAVIKLRIRRRAKATLKFEHCENLGSMWQAVVPKIRELTYTEESGTDYVALELELPAATPTGFYRALYAE